MTRNNCLIIESTENDRVGLNSSLFVEHTYIRHVAVYNVGKGKKRDEQLIGAPFFLVR
jgi:hypothetical protein